MNIYLSSEVLIIWLSIFIFEVIHLYINWVNFKKKMKKNETVMFMVEAFKKSPNFLRLWKMIYNPFTLFVLLMILAIISPVVFIFSAFSLLKKLVGYKSKLQKQAEAEEKAMEEAKKKSEEFMKNEVVENIGFEFEPEK